LPAPNQTIDEVKRELKQLLVQNLSMEGVKPEDIGDDVNLFGEGGVGLDSLDAVEVVVLLQRRYGLDVRDMQNSREIFRSINTLAAYVMAKSTK
jgi:acyl carrier protein